MSTRELTDPERLLIMFDAASEKNISLDDELIDSYVYLLKIRDIPFRYSFIFHPLPYSDELRRDIFGLTMAGYLEIGSIKITQKGKDFVTTNIMPKFKDVYERIKEYLPEFRRYSRTALFDAVYARIM
jgi:uncharacterized protein YwgA